MKKILLLLTSAVCLLTSYLFSQSTAIIGTGTNFNNSAAYPAPYGNFYWGARHQILIRASEMTAAGMAAGNITALAFQVQTPAGTPLTSFTIRMKTTPSASVNSNFDNIGFVTVYGPQTFTDASGWNNHTFSTPFAWNGTSNILIETCFDNNSWTQNAQMNYSTTSYNSVLYFFQDMNPNICSAPSGNSSMNRPNIKFTYTPNGPPTSQFTANPTNTCSGNVQFTDQSFYNITAWLWNFGDGATSNAQNPLHTYTASGTYSVSLKATNANGNNTLAKPNYITVSLSGTPLTPASCTPTTTSYCCGFGITNFQFDKINNNSPDGSAGYEDYTCNRDTVTTGQWYNISVSNPSSPSTQNYRVWMDFNNDGTFTPPGELVFAADNVISASGNVFIPGTATLNTPLRVRVSADQSLQAIPTPCSNLTYGQAEDYAIIVKPNTSPPVAKFYADDTVSCSGTVQFTDQSLNVPNQWLWNFGDATTSNQQNPLHTYTANGTYSVSLTATNANGNNMLVKSNYILVTLGNTPVAPSCQAPTLAYCCGYGIYKVQMNTINKSSADGSEGYKDFSCTGQTTLTEGQTYSVSIQTSPSLAQDTKLWIDLNNDGTFNQANELLFSKASTINPSGTITIPTGVAVYSTLLRMRIVSDNGGSNPTACTVIKGQAEDYAVTVLKLVSAEEFPVSGLQFTVYPNPFSETATLRITNGNRITNYELKVFDLYGKEVNPSVIRNSEGFVIRKSNLAAGIYIYEVSSESGVVGKGKLVVSE
ncbi:MAG: PKD domain-containing protein [Bacteroidetes bacterium]|nr:PKD domain-containing protein [Bacteroidota bacterium]